MNKWKLYILHGEYLDEEEVKQTKLYQELKGKINLLVNYIEYNEPKRNIGFTEEAVKRAKEELIKEVEEKLKYLEQGKAVNILKNVLNSIEGEHV